MEADQGRPSHVAPSEGASYMVLGELVVFKADGEQTGSEHSVFEDLTHPGYAGPPPHRHLRQVESFYVLEGEFEFRIGERVIPATPGAFVHLPKGTLHTFRTTGGRVGRLLVTVSPPGDFERFVKEVGEPTEEKCKRSRGVV
jgi:mannose-6-phosphate isomerase-like protein (cupin superfamily)